LETKVLDIAIGQSALLNLLHDLAVRLAQVLIDYIPWTDREAPAAMLHSIHPVHPSRSASQGIEKHRPLYAPHGWGEPVFHLCRAGLRAADPGCGHMAAQECLCIEDDSMAAQQAIALIARPHDVMPNHQNHAFFTIAVSIRLQFNRHGHL